MIGSSVRLPTLGLDLAKAVAVTLIAPLRQRLAFAQHALGSLTPFGFHAQ